MKLSPKLMLIVGIVAAIIMAGSAYAGYTYYQNTKVLNAQLEVISTTTAELTPEATASEKVKAYTTLMEKWAKLNSAEIKPQAQAKYEETLKDLKDQIATGFETELTALENNELVKSEDLKAVEEATKKLEDKLNEVKTAAEAIKDPQFLQKQVEKSAAVLKTYQERVGVLQAEAKRKAEEEAKRKAEEEAKRKAEEEAKARQAAIDNALAESANNPAAALQRILNDDWPLTTYENEYFVFGPVPVGWAFLKDQGNERTGFPTYHIQVGREGYCYGHGSVLAVAPPGTKLKSSIPIADARVVGTTSNGLNLYEVDGGAGGEVNAACYELSNKYRVSNLVKTK